jgi:hypothetical protein
MMISLPYWGAAALYLRNTSRMKQQTDKAVSDKRFG